MPLISCEVSVTLTWSEKCVLTDITPKTARNANPNANPLVEGRERKDAQQYQHLNIYFLEQLKSGFKRTIKLNKCRSEMTNQTKTSYLNYLIDPLFTKANRLFVLPFENEEDRTSF